MGWYTWIIITGIIAILIFLIAVFRCNSNRSRIRNNIKRAGKIRDGIDRAGQSNNQTAEHLETLGNDNQDAQRRTEDIKRNNQSAKDGIKFAKDILKRAKKRSDNP
ncbi:hypothetical protein KAR91_67530 [Candidatus Pacearchaeota archaeon]|nr:hypothetical protein [Candidatus Pacearchaeota archaeon]